MVQTATGVLVGAVVMAAGVVFTTPAFFGAIFSRVTPAERGAASGTASAFLDLAFGGGPVLVGVVASRSGIRPASRPQRWWPWWAPAGPHWRVGGIERTTRRPSDNAAMPPIDELTRIEPVHLERLERQGIFTTGLLLERSETTTRRQTLADQVDATTNDVGMWRDEALMLNLASFGPAEHQLLIQARIEGLRDVLALPLDVFRDRIRRGAQELGTEPPTDLTMDGWWDQAHTLEDE